MEFTAKQISSLLGGKVEGDENVKVDRLSKIEEGTAGSLSFLANPKYIQHIYTTKASLVIVNDDFVAEQPAKDAEVCRAAKSAAAQHNADAHPSGVDSCWHGRQIGRAHV